MSLESSIVGAMLLTLLAMAGTAWGQATPVAPNGRAWQTSATLTQGLETNIFYAAAHPQSDTTTHLQVSVQRRWQGAHWSWTSSYTPEATAYGRHSRLDYISQSYLQTFQLATSAHTQWSWNTTAAHYPQRGGAPTAGLTSMAGASAASQALGLQTVLSTATSTLGVTHETGTRTSWNASGFASIQGFQADRGLLAAGGASAAGGNLNVPAASRSSNLGGTLGWNYQLTPGRRVQLGASDSEIWFHVPMQRMRSSSVQATLTQDLGGRMQLALGAGPAWNWVLQSSSVGPRLPQVGYTGSASLSAELGWGEYGIAWQHGVQLGQVLGAVTTDNLAMQYSWRLGMAWSASTSLGQTHGAGAAGTNLESTYAAAQLNYAMTPAWRLQASSSYSLQGLPGVGGFERLRHLQGSAGITFTPGGAQ